MTLSTSTDARDRPGAADRPDVIDRLAGIRPGDAGDRLRSLRPQTRRQAQASHFALFQPSEPAAEEGSPAPSFTVAERFAVAAFVARLHGDAGIAGFYAQALAQHEASALRREAVAAEAEAGAALAPAGPYGRHPPGPLTTEDRPGPRYAVAPERRDTLGRRLAAALEHAHLLVLHPRDARAADLQVLLDAGWSADDVVTLSQLVAFLAFQIRAAVGLRVLAGVAGAADAASSSPTAAPTSP